MALIAKHGISIVLPAYNEEENIAKAVQQFLYCAESLFLDWEIIVVNDGSRDNTGAVMDNLARQNSSIRVVHHPTNAGYGAALRSGIQSAKKELIFFCDSDLQFHSSELLLLLIWIEQYDIVIGYRANRNDPIHRRLNAFGWNRLVRLVLGLKVRDIDCAYKLFRSAVFRDVEIRSVGAMVNTEILAQATRMGYTIKEIPVSHFPRVKGNPTGANLKVIIKAFRELFGLYNKLRAITACVVQHDRRSMQGKELVSSNKRQEIRRRYKLPINFHDRRTKRYASDNEERMYTPLPPQEVAALSEAPSEAPSAQNIMPGGACRD